MIIELLKRETVKRHEELSVEIGLSRVHVYRKMKHLTGLTVSEFIRNIKLN
jgi:AraC-like DNA-binding protein